jgi:urease gamma subunit
MVNPLSITASIIAVIQVTSKVVSLCYDYRSGLKNSSKEVKQLTDEIISLRDVLESILKLVDEDGVEHTHLSTLKLLTKSDRILPSCKEEMALLEKELQPVAGIRATVSSVVVPRTTYCSPFS